jgi:CRISPR-associated endoribonuclease Cas6
MILLRIELALDTKPKPMSFYGGVLHGMVAQPQLAELLPKNAQLSLIAPPVIAHDSVVQGNAQQMQFGVVMHHVSTATTQQWVTQFAQLCHSRKLHLAGVTCKVLFHQLIDPDAFDMPTPETSVHELAIEWLTPTLISTAKKQALGLDKASPSLSSVVNSVIHRIAQIEPIRATRLGYEKSTWAERIQALHSVRCTNDQTYFFSDHYDSSRVVPVNPIIAGTSLNIGQSVPFKSNYASHRPLIGRIGKAFYTGRIDPIFLHILQWGQWFGAGQGVSQGRGCYRLIF